MSLADPLPRRGSMNTAADGVVRLPLRHAGRATVWLLQCGRSWTWRAASSFPGHGNVAAQPADPGQAWPTWHHAVDAALLALVAEWKHARPTTPQLADAVQAIADQWEPLSLSSCS